VSKKAFYSILALILLTSALCFLIRHYSPSPIAIQTNSQFPLSKGQWSGTEDQLSQAVLDMLKPDVIFSGAYLNSENSKVALLFQYYAPQNTEGTPHSPRNCLPGSGWIIENVTDLKLNINGREIKGGRFIISLENKKQAMDFWYITRFGETANDYRLKLYMIAASLTFRPHDVAFVRVVGDGDPAGLAAIADFEQNFIGEVYKYLPFSTLK
jgi:EpsI family protein